jgi:putative intracellular protease/amidase
MAVRSSPPEQLDAARIYHRTICMKHLTSILAATALGATLMSAPAQAQEKGKVLIVLSSATDLPLKNGTVFKTGYYLNELIIPAEAFAQAGYQLVFADPKGNMPAVDQTSINAEYFDGSNAALQAALNYQVSLRGQLSHPLTLGQVAHSDLSQYGVIFVPGGPAPTIDLMANPELGSILRYFHAHNKTTVLLCHGPTALLSAAENPLAMQAALRAGNDDTARTLAVNWPYKGYKMTVFSDEEENIAVQYVFHAEPLLYPQKSLEIAGGNVSTAAGWQPLVVQDRELITGQNPASDRALMKVVLPVLLGSK